MTDGPITVEACLAKIASDVVELTKEGGLLDRLSAAISQPAGTGIQEKVHSTGYESREPWNGGAAILYFTILAEAVELEVDLRWRLTGKRLPGRTKSHAGAKAALDAVPELAAHQEPRVVRMVGHEVRRLAYMIRSSPHIDDESRLVSVKARCPYCHEASLVVPKDLSDDVVCRTEGCVNPVTKEQPRWHRWDWIRLYDATRTDDAA